MPLGRPTDYNPEISKEICDTIARSSIGIRRLCKERPHWPHPDTIFEWKRKHKAFSDQYAQARRDQIEVFIDEIVDIADDTSNDIIENKNGDDVCNTEFINRSRLRIDTRKWIASKLAPKIYGEKNTPEDKADTALNELAAIKDIVTRCMKPMV